MFKLPKNVKIPASHIITQHFFMYIMHAQGIVGDIKDDSEKKLVQAWIDKLTEEPHPRYLTIVKRNMYMAQLLINVYDSKLRSPFTCMPPQRPLETFDDLKCYGERGKREEKPVEDNGVNERYFNNKLSLEDLNHISSDQRTYVAIRSLANGATLIGYVAVTIGDLDGDLLWVNSEGKPIQCPEPSIRDLPVVSSTSQTLDQDTDDRASYGLDDLVDDVWKALSERRTLEIREHANNFYDMLYGIVEREMLAEETDDLGSTKCRDPYVEKLIDYLKKDLMADGIDDLKELSHFDLLSMLKKRVTAIINKIRNRQEVLEEVENTLKMPAMQLLSRPTTGCPSFRSVMTLQESLTGTTDTRIIDFLLMRYPSDVVKKFEKVIVSEKIRAMQLIKTRFDSVTFEMYRCLRESILRGLRGYQAARKEWARAWQVLKEYEEASKQAEKSIANRSYDKFLEIIEDEIVLVEKQLTNARSKPEIKETKIESLRKSIHEQMENVLLEKMDTEGKIRILKEEISSEEITIQKRADTIRQLKIMIDDLMKN